MAETTQQLLNDLADYLKVAQFPRNADGAVELAIGEATPVFLFTEDSHTLMMVCPVMPVPAGFDTDSALWLLRLNFYTSPLAPFRAASDAQGQLLLWGRLPVKGMGGADLAGVLDGLAEHAEMIRGELASDPGDNA